MTALSWLVAALILSDGFARVPDPAAQNEPVIGLERTSCFGTCPVYRITIDGSGTVTYTGAEYVRVGGRHTTRIEQSAVANLLRQARQIGFFELRDEYRHIQHADGTTETWTDLPTTIVTITANGRTKRIEDYLGAPRALSEFEDEIDRIAGTIHWIFLDDASLDELQRAGWSGASDEGSRFLYEAIERDEVPIARRLIQLGADPRLQHVRRPASLVIARSGAMVDVLVQAGADPSVGVLGNVVSTPLMSAASKDVDVAEALVKAGAHVDDADQDGRTALWYAACRGNWRMVDVLLRAGANPRGSTGTTALECAWRARVEPVARRPLSVLDAAKPTVEDFDKVIDLLDDASATRSPH